MSLFDGMAPTYDTPQRAQVAGIIANAIRAQAGPSEDKSALDYGCGTGLVGLPLASAFQSLLLVDASQPMVEEVQRKIDAAGAKNAATLCADFAVGVPAGLGADVVFMAQVLLHIPDVAGILRALCGVVHPGGRLFIVDFDKDDGITQGPAHNGFVQAHLQEAVLEAGFSKASSHTFYHGEKLFMNRDASLFLLEAWK